MGNSFGGLLSYVDNGINERQIHITFFIDDLLPEGKQIMIQETSSINDIIDQHLNKTFPNVDFKNDYEAIYNNRKLVMNKALCCSEVREYGALSFVNKHKRTKGRGMACVEENLPNQCIVFKSRNYLINPTKTELISSFELKSLHISCRSDKYVPNTNYIGIILYQFKQQKQAKQNDETMTKTKESKSHGSLDVAEDSKEETKTNIHTTTAINDKSAGTDMEWVSNWKLNYVKCQTGYIIIKKSDAALTRIKNKFNTTWHGSLYQMIFKKLPNDGHVMGAGFAIQNKHLINQKFDNCYKLYFNSRTFNLAKSSDDVYHDVDVHKKFECHKLEKKWIAIAVNRWKNGIYLKKDATILINNRNDCCDSCLQRIYDTKF